jgi:hypothetical protein
MLVQQLSPFGPQTDTPGPPPRQLGGVQVSPLHPSSTTRSGEGARASTRPFSPPSATLDGALSVSTGGGSDVPTDTGVVPIPLSGLRRAPPQPAAASVTANAQSLGQEQQPRTREG